MKVLLVGLFNEESSAVNAGYSNAVNGIAQVFKKMVQNKDIELLQCVSIQNVPFIKLEHKFDVSLSFVHPRQFLSPQFMGVYQRVFQSSNKNFLNIVFESSPLPQEWDAIFKSEIFTGFTAPSEFILSNIISDKPKFYLPHYVDLSLFPSIDIQEKEKEKIFSCLTVGQNTYRKGLDDAVIAFTRALGNRSDTQLIIKYHEMSSTEVYPFEPYIKHLSRVNCPHFKSKIFTLNQHMENSELYELYKANSLLLNLTKAEGFGYCGLEAMVIGIPVVYTNWSSTAETCVGPGNIPVKFILDHTIGMAQFGFDIESFFAHPLIASAYDAIKLAYGKWGSNRRAYYEEVLGNRELIDKKYGYNAIRDYLLKVLV